MNFKEEGLCTRCPYALAVAPDGVVWVSSIGSGTNARGYVHLFDPALPGGGDISPAVNIQLRGAAMFAAFIGDKTSYRAFVPERSPTGDHLRIYQSAPSGQAPTEIGDIAFDRADCQNAHMLLAEGARGYLICEGDHVHPGTFVWLDLDARTVLGSRPIGVFPDGLALVRTR